MSEFETVHRALREPVTTRIQRQEQPGQPGTDTTWTQVDMAALLSFEARTGPLVDDLVEAARDMLKFGEHESPCVRDSEGRCPRHMAMSEARREALEARIAELDEVAGRG